MEENILDQLEPLKKNSYYQKSKRNFIVAFVSTSLCLLFLSAMIMSAAVISGTFLVIGVFIGLVFGVLGVVNGVKSYIAKEKNARFRMFFMVGNILITSVFLFLIVAIIKDVIWAYF